MILVNDDLKVLDLYNATSPTKVNSFNKSIQSSYTVESNFEQFEANFEWLELMEDTVRYLDNIMRNPNRFIVNEEEVVKVEKAKRITVESIKHLSKHTNFIQEIDKNGDVKPSKVLNILKDESFNTYENRVIYTLIQNMRLFVETRKRNLITASFTKDVKKSTYTGVTRIGNESINVNLSLDSRYNANSTFGKVNDLTIEQRIERLELKISDLTNTEVYKQLAKEHVARVIPPIKKTNLILKNVNFQYAMKLWDFISNYEEGKEKAVKNSKVFENDAKTKEMFDDVFLLNYLVVNSLSSSGTVKSEKRSKEIVEQLTNNMINKIVEINSDLPMAELEKLIGDRIAVIKNKREASISEISQKFNAKIQSALSKIINFELR